MSRPPFVNVLVTGGAGFIGTHLSRRLLREGCRVTVLDTFHSQVHGARTTLAADLAHEVELIVGDVRDPDTFGAALVGQEVVIHFAADTGTAQSMYEVVRYEEMNVHGTAVLVEHLATHPRSSVQKVVLASSRAVYGEGKYSCPAHGVTYPVMRRKRDLLARRFEPACQICGSNCTALSTDEASPLQPTSFYGLTKQTQDQMVLMYGRALGLSAYALRYQNVYGPGQSLTNPYTGVLAIFSTLARQGRPIRLFEDGLESRDFVHVEDVVEATWRAIRTTEPRVEAINVGTGVPTTIAGVADLIVDALHSSSTMQVTGEWRSGDIRHNFADLTKARRVLSFEPRWSFAEGLPDFLAWALREPAKDLGDASLYATLEHQPVQLHG